MKRKSRRQKGSIHRNILLICLSIIFAFILSRLALFHIFLAQLGGFGYVGAFIAGILFDSTFTVAIGAVTLVVLAETHSPIEIALIAGAGGAVGDLIILHLVKYTFVDEIKLIYYGIGGRYISKLFTSKYVSWSLPFIGALIIASPFPDELGVTLMGISKIKTYQFVILSFILDTLGVLAIILAAEIITI